ncbi:MAG: hypothetical protein K9W44_11130 [Candidatus Lokiarchaeota archaeon]|nr:hypothetical protein [Candidatus Harpocratesius repetitus]
MSWIDDILNFLAPITPYVKWLIVFITPIYITLGEIFAKLALAFIKILPSDSYVMSYIIAGVFVVLGIVFGVISEKNQKEKTEAGLVENTYADSYSSTQDLDDSGDSEPSAGQSTYFGGN